MPDEQQTETKTVNQYKMTLKSTTDTDDPDAIKLHIQLSNEFNDLLKNVAVTTNEPVEATYYSGQTNDRGVEKYQRYRIKEVGCIKEPECDASVVTRSYDGWADNPDEPIVGFDENLDRWLPPARSVPKERIIWNKEGEGD